MSDEIPHPSTQYFMGWSETPKQQQARLDKEAAAVDRNDDAEFERLVDSEPPIHVWPLMNYNVADARWKLGQTSEVELYALCGVRVYQYIQRLDSRAPVQFADHWSYRDDVCPTCISKWEQRDH